MSLFGNLKTDGLEKNEDRLGGFTPIESDTYDSVIKYAYLGKASNSKARSVTFAFGLPDGREHRETLWITNKSDENWYETKNGKKAQLGGFVMFNDICAVALGHEASDLPDDAVEEKMVELYDRDAGKAIPKAVPMIMPLVGKEVTLGLLQQLVNKQVKNDAGVYVDTPDTRTETVIDKVFHTESGMTVAEAVKAGGWDAAKAEFKTKWVEKNKGSVRDRTNKDVAPSQNGRSGRPAGAPPKAADAPKRSSGLFS